MRQHERGRHPGMTSARCVALVGVALLSGCSWVSGWFSSSSSSAPAREIKTAAACPSAVILRPLSQTALFGADQPRQPAGVAFYGALSEVTTDCDRSGDSLRLKLDVVVVEFEAQRIAGPVAIGGDLAQGTVERNPGRLARLVRAEQGGLRQRTQNDRARAC